MPTKNKRIAIYLSAATLLILAFILFKSYAHRSPAADEHEEDAAASYERGPHGGRLLEQGDLALEITVYEDGPAPRFRIYPYAEGKELAPEKLSVSISLRRIDGEVDLYKLEPQDSYLTSPIAVAEPHSFDVAVDASFKGKDASWTFSSYEGRTQISDSALASAGITVEKAGPARISQKISASGRVNPNEDRLQRISPRYAGVVKELRKRLGDSVQKGEVLAIIESNVSIAQYEIRSQYQGTVLTKNATLGSYVAESDVLYTIADLSTVWVDFNVYRKDFASLKKGQKVVIYFEDDEHPIEGEISYLSAVGTENTQAFIARAEIANPKRDILPGLFVHGSIIVDHEDVPLAVRPAALQTFRDWTVVFVRFGNSFEFRPLELGRRDEDWVEVKSGLKPGQDYVSKNSFLIKADILKSGASHDH